MEKRTGLRVSCHLHEICAALRCYSLKAVGQRPGNSIGVHTCASANIDGQVAALCRSRTPSTPAWSCRSGSTRLPTSASTQSRA